jgi:hypothetical protein
MLDFQNWSDNNNLVHLHTRGAKFTWSNGRRGRNNTQKRLDRVIVNQDLINSCQSFNVCTLTKLRSDHFPLLFDFQIQNNQFSSSFKFLKMWISHPDCINIIKQCWNNNVSGCPMFILSQKHKLLKEALKVWNKKTFGDVHSQVSLAYKELADIQMNIDAVGSSDLLLD